MNLKKTLITLSAAAILGTVGLAAAPPTSAEARVVCNRDGDCWRTKSRYKYPRDLGVRVYSNRYSDQAYRDSRWRDRNRTYRDERHDRGYYKSGVWVQF